MPFRYPTFEAVIEFNRQEVIGSSEEYRLEDEKSLRKILDDVKEWGEDLSTKDALIKKASFMLFRISRFNPFMKVTRELRM